MTQETVSWKLALDGMKIGGIWIAPALGLIIKKISEDTVTILEAGATDSKTVRGYCNGAGYKLLPPLVQQ